MGITSLCLNYLFLERANGLAKISGGNRRHCSFERARVLNALGLHVFEELRPDFCFLDEVKHDLGLGLVDRSSVPVVIVTADHDVEDIAYDVAMEERIGASYCLHA